MNQKQTFKRDNLIIEIIKNHIGKDNAISGNDLCKALNEKGYSIKQDTIHSTVSKIIKERYLPICSLNGNGYYFPKSKDDIQTAISHLQSRVDKIQNRIDFLKQFLF